MGLGYSRYDEHEPIIHKRQLPPINGAKLERHLSHPNLRPRPTARRQLPKTPAQPPGTIIVIENVLPPQQPPCANNSNKVFLPSKPRGRYGESPSRRSHSLPRRHREATQPFPPSTSRRSGTGRRLPRTPTHSSLALHHTPAEPRTAGPRTRRRELPKPRSLDLRFPTSSSSNRNKALLNNAARSSTMANNLMHRISSKTMNFPRLESSPSHSSTCSLSHDMGLEFTVPLPSIPPALRTTFYRNRRTLLE